MRQVVYTVRAKDNDRLILTDGAVIRDSFRDPQTDEWVMLIREPLPQVEQTMRPFTPQEKRLPGDRNKVRRLSTGEIVS